MRPRRADLTTQSRHVSPHRMNATSTRQKIKEALNLFQYIPDDTKQGVPAGSRDEGKGFRNKMRAILEPTQKEEFTTAIGKSSKGIKIDGSAIDRLSFKFVKFARDSSKRDSTLIVAVNAAFTKYKSKYWDEIKEQIHWLNSKSEGGKIHLLETEDDYKTYIKQRFP